MGAHLKRINHLFLILFRPLQCPNSYCGVTISDCAGVSNCPLDRPFKCYNTLCVKEFTDCPIHPRTYHALTMQITVNPISHLEIDIVFDDENRVYGTLYIPSNTQALSETNEVSDMEILISSVADSSLKEYPISLDSEQVEYTRQILQAGFSTLDPLVTILSPVVSISTSQGSTFFSNQISLSLLTGVPLPLDSNLQHICLSQIDSEALLLRCISRTIIHTIQTVSGEYKLVFNIQQTGIYAVTFNPLLEDEEDTESCGWPCDYPREFVFTFFGSLFLVLVIIFSLWCVAIQTEEWRMRKLRGKGEIVGDVSSIVSETDLLPDHRNKIPIGLRRDSSQPLNFRQGMEIKKLEEQVLDLNQANRKLRKKNQDLGNFSQKAQAELLKAKEEQA
jgi:hypothetical protein